MEKSINCEQKEAMNMTSTMIKKSLTFGPQKITLKLIYGHFPLGGAEKAPPASNRVHKCFGKG